MEHTPQNQKTPTVLSDKLTKHATLVKKGKTFLIIFSFISLVTAMYLMHLESIDRPFQGPVFKPATR